MYFPFLILLMFLKPHDGFMGDIYCWMDWSIFNVENGISNIYKHPTANYLPLSQYILYFFGKYQGSVENIINNIFSIKNIALAFELGTTLLLFKLLEEKFKNYYKALFLSLFYFLNLGVLYNALIWGQIDGIMVFFIFGSIFFMLKKRIFLSMLFFLFAVNTKLQAIIFLPILILMILPIITERSELKKFLLALLSVTLVQFIIILPFIIAGDFKALTKVVFGSVDHYAVVSMNAFNMWHILLDTNPIKTPDSIEFLGISYKNWGLLLFFIFSFFALFHFLKPIYNKFFKKVNTDISQKKIIISCALIPLIFFFFNTQMHERYSQPVLIFLAAYAMLYKKPVPFILGSIACFLNMEKVLQFFKTNNYHTLVFTPWFIACIYLLVIVLLFIDLYDIKLIKKNLKVSSQTQ
ncbi:MAG: hypothetical protein LBQ22_11515 [Bacteroidales bacterium]|nr:hypothetical protein [Bacteroidales bacterium]